MRGRSLKMWGYWPQPACLKRTPSLNLHPWNAPMGTGLVLCRKCHGAYWPISQIHNAPGKYLTMHHFVTEMCTFLLQNGALCDMEMVHYGICALWTGLFHTRPQCIRQISHSAPFCSRNMHISVTKWCIVGYGNGALWDLCNRSLPRQGSYKRAGHTYILIGTPAFNIYTDCVPH